MADSSEANVTMVEDCSEPAKQENGPASGSIAEHKLVGVRKAVESKLQMYKNDGEKDAGKRKANEDDEYSHLQQEADVGIKEFVNDLPGFQGILKNRYSDFVVNEIDENGTIVHLTDLTIPKDNLVPKAEEFKVADGKCPDCIDSEVWEKIIFINNTRHSCETVNIKVTALSKEERQRIHMTVKTMCKELDSNTIEKNGEKCIVVRRKRSKLASEQPWAWRFSSWPKARPPYTHFVLYKESWDTFSVINLLAEKLKVAAGKFHVAGTKDRRGKTTQRLCAKKVPAEKLMEAVAKINRLRIGNVEYKKEKLSLGQLTGNRFGIVLRNLQGTDDTVNAALSSLIDRGFINYYGMQRFGSSSVPSHHIGLAMLVKNWRLAFDLILAPRHGESDEMQKMRHIYAKTKDPEKAFAVLNYKMGHVTTEGRILHSLIKLGGKNYHDAIEKLPHNQRMMYCHAYQSYIWNQLVSRRIAQYGLTTLVGDLYYPDGWDDTQVEDGEEENDSEDEVLPSSSKSSRLPSWKKTRVPPMVTEENVASVTINQVVMTVPGWNVEYPENDVGQWYQELLEKDDTDTSLAWVSHNRYSGLCGAYRRLVMRPVDLKWSIWRYSDPNRPLIQSDVDIMDNLPPPKENPEGEFRALVLEFSLLSSCYATMAMREITRMDTSQLFLMSQEHQSTQCKKHKTK